jgi:hypothetical protein
MMQSPQPTRRALAAAIAALLSIALHAQSTEVQTVLDQAAQYVRTYQQLSVGLAAEENYVQESTTNNSRTRRRTKADLVLVRVSTEDVWAQFRDVFEVDGEPVRDRDNRLQKLVLNASGTTLEQLRAIASESARYNLGFERTVNVPVLSLLFLDPTRQPQFEFTIEAERRPGGRPSVPHDMPNSRAFEMPGDAVELRYREVKTPTLVRTEGNRDLPASGRFWIDSRGRVLASELILDSLPVLHSTIDVAYQPGPLEAILVPREMRESYTITEQAFSGSIRSTRRTVIAATATYSNVREFKVQVEEQIDTGRK